MTTNQGSGESTDEDLEGCDIDFAAEQATPDEALPAAMGGPSIIDGAEDMSGCDMDFHEQYATPDNQLPAAQQGVA